jgi:hypothetical protein
MYVLDRVLKRRHFLFFFRGYSDDVTETEPKIPGKGNNLSYLTLLCIKVKWKESFARIGSFLLCPSAFRDRLYVHSILYCTKCTVYLGRLRDRGGRIQYERSFLSILPLYSTVYTFLTYLVVFLFSVKQIDDYPPSG